MGGDQISIIAIPVISVIPQVCLLSRNDWCWFQQFYQLVCCAIRCFPCQNTPMASEDRKKISFPQPVCTSRKLQHISESCETASPFLCIIFPFAKQFWLPFHLLVWLSLCRRGSQNSIFIIKKNLPSPKSFVLLKTLEAALGWRKSATMLTCTSQGLNFPSVILCQSVDLQRIFSLENFSTSTFLHRVKLGIDAFLLI